MLIRELTEAPLRPGAKIALIDDGRSPEWTRRGQKSPLIQFAPQLKLDTRDAWHLASLGKTDYCWDLIEQNCSGALHSMRAANRALYRGLARTTEAFLGQSRTDRRPMNTEPGQQEIIDEFLRRAGFQAVRSNSIFATGERETARDYGYPYYVFPFDSAHTTWNRDFSDFFYEVARTHGRGNVMMTTMTRYVQHDISKTATTIRGAAANMGFVSGDLERALRSGHEIYISGTYYAVFRGAFDGTFGSLMDLFLSGRLK